MNRFLIRLLLAAIVCGSVAQTWAATIPPPDPNASCARDEYSAAKPQGGIPTSSAIDPPTLVVVTGRKPINTTQQIKMGEQVTVCIMGLHDWIYRQKKNPGTLRLFIGGYLLTKIAPSSISPENQEYLNFILQMDTANSDDWKAWPQLWTQPATARTINSRSALG